MTRILTILFVVSTWASFASAQGLPLTDQLGGSSGSVSGSTYRSPRTTTRSSRPRTTTSYRPSQRSANGVNNGGFRPVTYPQNQMQTAQQIANAVAALGPAIQQTRQNLQQMRAQNGGTLFPRNNHRFGNQNGFVNRWAPQNRYGDYFTPGDAQQVRRDLMRSGYRNVQVVPHPHNRFYGGQPARQRWGVHYGNRW